MTVSVRAEVVMRLRVEAATLDEAGRIVGARWRKTLRQIGAVDNSTTVCEKVLARLRKLP